MITDVGAVSIEEDLLQISVSPGRFSDRSMFSDTYFARADIICW